jgi:hypothetical protein
VGLFDEVNIVCPECGSFVEFQSKAGDCHMHSYRQNSVPTEIAKDILNNIQQCSCGYSVRAILAPRSITTVEMVGV